MNRTEYTHKTPVIFGEMFSGFLLKVSFRPCRLRVDGRRTNRESR